MKSIFIQVIGILQIDIVIASFVDNVNCIFELRAILGEKGKKIAIVSNIQTIEGFRNFDTILEVSRIFFSVT